MVFHGPEELKGIEEYSATFQLIEDDILVIRRSLSPSSDTVPMDDLLVRTQSFTRDWKNLPMDLGKPEHSIVNVEGTVVRCLKAVERLSQITEKTLDSILSSPFFTVSGSDVGCIDMDKVK